MVNKYQIERAAIDQLGGEAALKEAIVAYKEALKEHSTTEGVAAPVAHPWVEAIVKNGGGKFTVIEPEPKPAPEPEPEKTFEELQNAVFNELKFQRYQAQNSGVTLRQVKFDSSSNALTALLAADIEATAVGPDWRERWKVGQGAFMLINGDDVKALIAMIRAKHKAAFEKEFEYSDFILASDTPKKLASIDFTKGWGD